MEPDLRMQMSWMHRQAVLEKKKGEKKISGVGTVFLAKGCSRRKQGVLKKVKKKKNVCCCPERKTRTSYPVSLARSLGVRASARV